MAKRVLWWKLELTRYVCEDCGHAEWQDEPEKMLDHLVGHRDDDGDRVPAVVLKELEGHLRFDPKSKELAKHFLSKYPGAKSWHVSLLSKAIQNAVEAWIADEEGSGALQGEKREDPNAG